MVAESFVWGIVLFFIGVGLFWGGNRFRLKFLNWIGIITAIIGAGMVVILAINEIPKA